MKYRWNIAPSQPLLNGRLASACGVSPLLAQCLLNRGFSEAETITSFLEPKLRNLSDPFLLPNMAAAVDRLFLARERGEAVVIFGDYDVDGVTSAALLVQTLRELGWKAECFLPHRMDEGYGLSRDGVENCIAKFPATLLLAVDCGSTARETIAWLGEKGVDVIVLDHHQVSDPPPAAVALVNPQLSESAFRELCSAGLAFKLAHAIVKRGRQCGISAMQEYDIRPLLDLVALGTIADLVPLTGESRILASLGLERLCRTDRPGIVALKKVCKATGDIGAYEAGYLLGPRLNAAGRMEDAAEALNLLLEHEPEAAAAIAERLDSRNRERQEVERGIAGEVVGAVKARFDAKKDFVIVEGNMFWHLGVVGIVASRVLHQFYRPTIILGGDGNEWRGSGRSIAGFDLAGALRQCDDLLVRHGGHAMAAGLTIKMENLDALRLRLNQLVQRSLKSEDLQPSLRLDGEVSLREVNAAAIRELGRLQPTGQSNPPVQLAAKNLTQARPLQRMGAEKQHVKMWVTDGSVVHETVWFGAGSNAALPVGHFDMAFAPQINEFNGRSTVQLKMLDWRPCQTQ
jgi:single-stranded-DNA-specific exonuclease